MRPADIIGVSALWVIGSAAALFVFVLLWYEERRQIRPNARRVKVLALGAVFCWLWPVSGLYAFVRWLTSTAFAATVRALFIDAFGKGAAK